MLSTDPKLSDPESAVSRRMASYGAMAEKIFIVVSASGKDYQLSENVFVYPVGRGLPFLRVGAFVRQATKIINNGSLNAENTIVTAQDPFDTGAAAVKLKEKFGLKIEMQIHGDIMSPYFAKQSILHRIRVLDVDKTLKKADKVRAVSLALARSIEHLVPKEKIYVLPVPIDARPGGGDVHFLAKKYPGLGLIMLMMARLEPEKNVDAALRLLNRVSGIDPRAGLVIVGDGSRKIALIKYAEKLGIRDRVSFEGWQKDPKDYLASAHLFLQTSNFEGYGMAVAEAALNARAILSTDVGIAHDLALAHAALVSKVGDEETMFLNAKLMLDQGRRVSMGLNAQKAIRDLIVTPEEFLSLQRERWASILG